MTDYNSTSYRLRQVHDVGIFKDTLAPSIAFHSCFSVAAWAAGRAVNRVDAKDWLWPANLVGNAWWSAFVRRVVVNGDNPRVVLGSFSRPEWLLLTGVTVWGARLFYRIATRSVKRGADDPRYVVMKKEEGFWTNALWKKFLPEGIIQAVIALPLTAPFTHQGGVLTGYHPVLQALAVGLWSTGFAMELIADNQLDEHQSTVVGRNTLTKEGMWSIVRHPNYLGDALIHSSFALLLYSSDMLAPLELLGPIANYLFLRYLGGDSENEETRLQRYEVEAPQKKIQFEAWKKEKNAFWPTAAELSNPWLWTAIGGGAVGIAVEQALCALLEY